MRIIKTALIQDKKTYNGDGDKYATLTGTPSSHHNTPTRVANPLRACPLCRFSLMYSLTSADRQ